VTTAVGAPVVMGTLIEIPLATFASHVVQPYWSRAGHVHVSQHMTHVSTINIRTSSQNKLAKATSNHPHLMQFFVGPQKSPAQTKRRPVQKFCTARPCDRQNETD